MNQTEEEFNQIRTFLLETSGLSLSSDKQYLVRSRLEPVAQRHQLQSLAAIIRRLKERNDVSFRDEVIDAMTTNETSFNRDVHPFDELRRSILPRLIQTLHDRKTRSGIPFPRIRIWSVAASTGQEPYSIAMAILCFLDANPRSGWTAQHFWILGTDISERALQIARAGLYSDLEIDRGISGEQKKKYFSPRDGQWLISPDVRKMVEFRRVNMLQNVADLAGFDLVFCRNLLIYFDEPTRFVVCQKLEKSLNPDGLLLLGAAEDLPASYDKAFRQTQFGRTIAFVKVSAANST